MSKTNVFLLLTLISQLAIAVEAEVEVEVETQANTDKPKQAVAIFQKQLGAELKTALSSGGATAAIEVCSKRAQIIAKEVGAQFEVEVRRVSEKYRNSANAPDETDVLVLSEFGETIKNENAAPLTKTVTLSKGQTRYYQGIVIQPLCLVCHGESLSQEVQDSLAKYYPEDKARGYSEGQLRGAFVVEF